MDVVLKTTQLTYELDGTGRARADARGADQGARGRGATRRRRAQAAPDLRDRAHPPELRDGRRRQEAPRARRSSSRSAAPSTSTSARTCSSSRTSPQNIDEIQAARRASSTAGAAGRDRSEDHPDQPRHRARRSACSGASTAAWRRSSATRPASAFPNSGTVGGRVDAAGPGHAGAERPARRRHSSERARRSTCRSPGATSRARPVAGRDQRRVQPRRRALGARAQGQAQDSVDAARHDAEQQGSGSHAGLPDSDSDRRRTTP